MPRQVAGFFVGRDGGIFGHNMKKVPILLFHLAMILLSGCKEVPLYFRSAQPRGGTSFTGDLTQYLISNFPKTMDSYDNNSPLFDALNDTLTGIEIHRYQNTAEMKLGFFNGLTWVEEFDISDSSFTKLWFDKGIDEYIIFKKENIDCFNYENDKGYFEIDMIFERNRINGDLIVIDKPFSVGKKNSLKDFDKLISYKRDEFDLAVVDINDTLKTYSADPSYMGFRWLLNRVSDDEGFPFKYLYAVKLFNAFEYRIKMDSIKYLDIMEFLDF